MVATENIPVGEVIGTEKPICSVLAAHKAGTQCSECLGMLPDDYFLPCLGCREARFCCPSCWRAGSAAGARSPHRLECGLRADLGPILKEVKGGDAVPEYHRLCLRLLGRMTVEEALAHPWIIRHNHGPMVFVDEMNSVEVGLDQSKEIMNRWTV